MDTNTIQVIETFGTKLDSYLQVLASKAGVATDHFWPIFVHQQLISGTIFCIGYIIMLCLAFFLVRMAVRNIGPASDHDLDNSVMCTAATKSFLGFTLGGIFIVVCLVGGPTFSESIGKVINPEYFAVQSLVQMVRWFIGAFRYGPKSSIRGWAWLINRQYVPKWILVMEKERGFY